jgi:hypothetical protein
MHLKLTLYLPSQSPLAFTSAGGKCRRDRIESIWACRAKVTIETRELPKAKKSDPTEYSFDVVYSDEPQ